tara:strand:- start:161 stop:535 length:375 start_codon:yes stop_codon:yes gene_type:complete
MAKVDRLAKRELRTYDKYTKAKEAGKAKKAGRLYDKLIDRQTKSISSGVNVNYDTGEYTIDKKKLGGMTGQDLDKIQKANENKNVMFSIMKDAYNKRKKKRGGATKMGMGGMCPPKVIQGKSLR